MNQVNYGIGQGIFDPRAAELTNSYVTIGQVTLHKLQLKKGALDKFRLPVDVLEGMFLWNHAFYCSSAHVCPGHLGKFTLSLHWMNLGNQPVEVIIEDVYLLVVPSRQGDEDPEEEENRIQAAKMERLENAELLHMRGQTVVSEGTKFRLSFYKASLMHYRGLSKVSGLAVLSYNQNRKQPSSYREECPHPL
jgi:vacuolar protein sorting-associated protein 13A/C